MRSRREALHADEPLPGFMLSNSVAIKFDREMDFNGLHNVLK